MSERILRALMQLFAIVAHPLSSDIDRRKMVAKYLEHHLDEAGVEEYLALYDKYYKNSRKRTENKTKIRKYTSASSVKVLRICTEINEELIFRQKVVVFTQLLEFLNLGKEISPQEMEFINTVGETFNLPWEGFEQLKKFILLPFDAIPDSSQILTISGSPQHKEVGECYISVGLTGTIKVLNLVRANMFVMRFEGITELFMNGQSLDINRVHLITQGSSIKNRKIDPIFFSDILSIFNRENNHNRVVFEAKNITYKFNEKKIGIHDLSFKEESGKMVGLIGSSGAGKTTLLNVLNGTSRPNEGDVSINGYNMFTDKKQLEGVVGYVSQDDLLMESLTVFENLYFNAKLCFDGYSNFHLIRTVLNLLKDLGLYEARNMKVGSPLDKKISGGQRKRLNIALELIREPSVLFLDEPTSGLSSRDSAKIMDMLKNLALKGKLIFVVIHQPSSDIFKMFDRLLILDTGGYLIFNGNPLEAVSYFKSQAQRARSNESECPHCGSVDAEQIFDIIESEILDEYGEPTQVRRVTPQQWFERFKNSRHIQKTIRRSKKLPPVLFKIPNKLKQFLVFTQRDILSKLSNKQYLVVNLFETPLLAFILAYIIKYYNIDNANNLGYTYSGNSNIPVYLFMAVIVALFIGLTVSAEEIIKDKKILKREAFLNLNKSSYLLSKIFILFTISAFQALLFTLIGNFILEIKGMFFSYWLVLFSAWSFANMMGLIISDTFRTVITVYILIPFILIPQIILSGVIVKFDKLNPSISSPDNIPFYGEIIVSRWAYEALAVKQFKDNEYEKNFYDFDKIKSSSDYHKNFWLPILRNKLNESNAYWGDTTKTAVVANNLKLLRNELGSVDMQKLPVNFALADSLTPAFFNHSVYTKTRKYLTALNYYYIDSYNRAIRKKDSILLEIQKSFSDKKAFIRMRKAYVNEQLTDFVRNSSDIERIINYNGKLYQKIDPIYRIPEKGFLKAHFYAPVKPFFKRLYSTYWVNIIVMWCGTILLYFVLYFQLLKRVIELFERKKRG